MLHLYYIMVLILKKILKVILSIVGIIVGLIIISWLFLFLSSNTNIPEGNTVKYMKGVWMPVPTDAILAVFLEPDRLKENGINTISIGPIAFNRFTSIALRPLYSHLVKKAHREGFAVHIAPLSWGPGFNHQENHLYMEDLLTREAIYWAKFAEKFNAEYLSPQNEHDVVLGNKEGARWAQEILPLIREEYTGEIILKMGQIPTDMGEKPDYVIITTSFGNEGEPDEWGITFSNVTGYDYMMIDLFPPNGLQDNTLFIEDLKNILSIANQEVEKKDLKGVMIGEFGYPREKPAYSAGIMPGPEVTPEQQAIMIGEYLEASLPRTNGVIYCGWNMAGYGFRGQPGEEVVREMFTSFSYSTP